jgi:uncharacterized membrane protein YczE
MKFDKALNLFGNVSLVVLLLVLGVAVTSHLGSSVWNALEQTKDVNAQEQNR